MREKKVSFLELLDRLTWLWDLQFGMKAVNSKNHLLKPHYLIPKVGIKPTTIPIFKLHLPHRTCNSSLLPSDSAEAVCWLKLVQLNSEYRGVDAVIGFFPKCRGSRRRLCQRWQQLGNTLLGYHKQLHGHRL